MLNRLRGQLSLLYLIAALALMILMGGSAYRLLAYYFETSTDLALRYRTALEFNKLSLKAPTDLDDAVEEWYSSRGQAVPTLQGLPVVQLHDEEAETEEEDHSSESQPEEGNEYARVYDSELSSIFVLPVDNQGQLLFNPNAYSPPISPDFQAVQSALIKGSDWRTISLPGGATRIRLFSYAVAGSNNPAVIQVGRSLADQDRILNQLLFSLSTLGGISAILIGAGSWWLAGRSLGPAQQAWNKQQSFVANASHELRTPLTLMRANAEVALRGLPPNEPARKYLEDILHESDHMSHLIDDLLLLSRLDAESQPLERREIEVADLLNDLARQLTLLAEANQLQLQTSIRPGRIQGDPTRLRQILLILFENALRHTPAGGKITISSGREGQYVFLKVTDNGSGIDPQYLPHVFERFYRSPADRSKTKPIHGRQTTNDRHPDQGSGLGLAIARGLVEAQGGKISIASLPGQGTQVSLHLPGIKDRLKA